MANLRVDKITSTETFETTGSVQFGNDNALKLSANSDFDLTSNDFTMEAWVYLMSVESFQTLLMYTVDGTEDDTSFQFDITSTQLRFVGYVSNSSVVKGSNFSFESGTWYHVAATRTNDLIRLFVDGNLIGTHGFTSTIDTEGSAELNIGYRNNNGTMDREVFGHLTNIRIVKGTALYTSNFKPSMRELEVVPDTVLLCCQSKTDASLEKTGKTITVLGSASANEITPGILTPVAKSGGGSAITGSVEFTSTTDALVLSAGTDFAYGTGDFTIEAWIQPQGINGGETKAIFTQSQSGNDYIIFKVDSDKAIKATFGSTTVSGGTVEVGSWHHVAVTRASNTVKIFVNGVASAGTTVSTDFSDTTRNPTIGQYTHAYGSIEYYGFISNFRINKGTALYTADFIPPTRELKNVPGTVLLCCQDENSVTTEITGKTITSNGDPTASNFTPQVGDDRQITFEGVTKINTDAYFYLPTGNTESRDKGAGTRGISMGGSDASAAINTIQYINISTTGNAINFGDLPAVKNQQASAASSTRGISAGGYSPNESATVSYITIASTGDAKDFGDLTLARRLLVGCSSQTRGIFAGGYDAPNKYNTMDYITIASTGDALDFGDMVADGQTASGRYGSAGYASPTRGVWHGGYGAPAYRNIIDYATIASKGNTKDFGDSSISNYYMGGCSNSIRGISGGAWNPSPAHLNLIEYTTIATTGNAQDFGDLIQPSVSVGACASQIRGVFVGGYIGSSKVNNISYVTLMSMGNAIDFGDLTTPVAYNTGCSNGHGGLG